MTATTTPRTTSSAALVPAKATLGVAAAVLILKGTLVSVDASGDADVITNGQDIVGVASATYDNRDGLARAINAELDFGVFEFFYTGTAPEIGQVLFAVDNQTVSVDSNGGVRGVAGFATANGVSSKVKLWVSPISGGNYADLAAVESIANAAAAQSENLSVVEIHVPLESFRLASGAALPAFNDGVADGLSIDDHSFVEVHARRHDVDRANPRIEITIEAIQSIKQSIKLPRIQ